MRSNAVIAKGKGRVSRLGCGHRCLDKTVCKHGDCCRESAARAARTFRQVYETAELLEHILLQLPESPKDLLRAQRVSKTWKATIDHSPKLQRRLFLAPDLQDAHRAWHVDGVTWKVTEAPRARGATYANADFKFESKLRFLARYNPLIFEPPVNRRRNRGLGSHTCLHFLLQGNKGLSIVPRDAIHRKMFLTAPPTKRLLLNYTFKRVAKTECFTTRISNEGGVTFGDLVDDYMRVAGPYDEVHMPSCGVMLQRMIFPTPEKILEIEQMQGFASTG
ncbi:hypothetical protein LTR65_008293 [Meristemomyces frigidus]